MTIEFKLKDRNDFVNDMSSSVHPFVEFVKPKQYEWKPQADITAWELAMALPCLFLYSHNIEQALAALPPNVTRHFSEVTNEAA